MKVFDIFESHISTSHTLNSIVQIIFYAIGVVFNIKIIVHCWETRKKNKSWQLHILCSVSCIIIFAFDIPFWLLSICIPHLSSHTGEWICYLALFLNEFFLSLIMVNSLMVAITKYTIIVHWDKALGYGHEKIQLNMIVISLLMAFYIAIFKTVFKRYNYGGPVQACLGTEYETARVKIVWEDLLWCSSENIALKEDWGYIHIKLLQIICVLTHGLYFIMWCNLPEAFFYYKIFKRMKRLEHKTRYLALIIYNNAIIYHYTLSIKLIVGK